VSWREERTTFRHGSIVNLLLASGCVIALTAICIGLIATAIHPGVPDELVIALLVVIALRLSVSLIDKISFFIRRRARLRRVRVSRGLRDQLRHPSYLPRAE
jgi:hypothetical protein